LIIDQRITVRKAGYKSIIYSCNEQKKVLLVCNENMCLDVWKLLPPFDELE
jgi:hypothetical protein